MSGLSAFFLVGSFPSWADGCLRGVRVFSSQGYAQNMNVDATRKQTRKSRSTDQTTGREIRERSEPTSGPTNSQVGGRPAIRLNHLRYTESSAVFSRAFAWLLWFLSFLSLFEFPHLFFPSKPLSRPSSSVGSRSLGSCSIPSQKKSRRPETISSWGIIKHTVFIKVLRGV